MSSDGRPTDASPYWERLRFLRTEAELGRNRLYARMIKLGYDEPPSPQSITAYEKDPREEAAPYTMRARSRYPTAEALEMICAGLGVPPDTFPEYRLAKAREQLDERASSLEEAVGRLDQITEALQLQAAQRSATTTKRQVERRHKLEAMPPEEETHEEDA